jgi:DNA invertase Pin-like site-specific DNA recombinase
MEVIITRATKKPTTPSDEKPLRVCAYCRVSTDKTDQWNSLEAQKKFFEVEFERNPNWIHCGIYADEGISGTSTEKRDAFNEMLTVAKAGDIDLIVTKEVSRFSRNLVDTITIVDQLAKKNVYVSFLADRINTAIPEERDRLDQLALYAQQESKRTSQRVRWGHQRCMERGVIFGRKDMYGYKINRVRKGVQAFEIIEDEAEIVRKIFGWYAQGDGTHVIAKRLEQMGVKSKYQNGWSNTVILRILRQEKYVGDLAQGKTFTPDPMTHKKKYNRGESDTFYIKDHHPESAIIERELWDRVQKRLIENSPSDEVKAKHNNRYWLSGKVYCGICGGRYVSLPKKQKHTPYKAWICFANHSRGVKKEIVNDLGETITVGCDAKRVNERVLLIALKDLLTYYLRDEKDNLINAILERVTKVQTQKVRTSELEKLQRKLDGIKVKKSRLLDKLLDEIVSKADYTAKNSELEEQMEIIQAQINELNSNSKAKAEIAELLAMKQQVEEMAGLDDADINEVLFGRVTKKIVVHPDNILEIHLSILPEPVFLKYETTGKGTEYNAIFDVVPNPKQ